MAAKNSKRHPYAAIEHRVIDSPAYASLTFSARALLLQIARQLNGTNNGHLQATHSYLNQYGFSENTITRGIAELIATGILYRSRAGGYQQGPAKYAVTWLPISKITEGIFLAGFKACAWRDWQPEDKKTPPPNVRTANRKNGEWTSTTPPKFAVEPPPKSEDIELVPTMASYLASSEPQEPLQETALKATERPKKGGRRTVMPETKIMQAREMIAHGMNMPDIAAHLGVSVPCLYKWVPSPNKIARIDNSPGLFGAH